MVIDLDNSLLVKELVNHLVEKGVTIALYSSIQMSAKENCWRITVMTPITPAFSDADWDGFKLSIEELIVKLTPPSLKS